MPPATFEPETLHARLSARWPDLEELGKTLVASTDGTLRSLAEAPADVGQQALRRLAQVEGALHQRLELGEELGRGGMGVVRKARQSTLQREVAVKALLEDRGRPDAALKMLQEAWITGTLEHPNVVPVYDIGLDDGGQPLIVLKRIQGRPWSELMADPQLVAQTFEADDPLEWHLRLFMQVCNAVEFAHRQGIIHLDIKPSNVMVGELGEVYLMDWGLALTLGDNPNLPRAAELRDVVGTPAYLAPEMLTADGRELSERTDIYLLGATLFEIVAGHPPHRAPSPVAMFFKAVNGPHELPEHTPDELAGIVRRAMAREPSDRFGGATELARAVHRFLQHRGSLQLSEQAHEHLETLKERLRAGAPRQAVYASYSAARFGFQQARKGWKGNEEARAGFRENTELMVRYELAQGEVRAAGTLAADLDPLPPELGAELRQAEEAQRRREAELAQLDPIVGQRTRFLAATAFGSLFVTRPLAEHFFRGAPVNPYPRLLILPWLYVIIIAFAAFLSRAQLGRSKLTRQFYATMTYLFGAQFALTVAAVELGVEPADFDVLLLFFWAVMAGTAAIGFERRSWPAAAGYALAFVTSLLVERGRFLLIAAAHATFVANVLWMWWPDAWKRGPKAHAP